MKRAIESPEKAPVEDKSSNLGWVSDYWREMLVVLGGLVAINAIFIFRAFRETSTIDRVAAGQLGDFVGGYIGTIFALTSVMLLLATLRSQRTMTQHQGFESKYFELLRMHRDNVDELQLQDTTGRRIFVLLIRELRSILTITHRLSNEHRQNLSNETLMHVAYHCLFFGTGPNSSRTLLASLKDFDSSFIEALEEELNKRLTKEQVQIERQLNHVPFEGHQSRLSHYYQHLLQMVLYVDYQKLRIEKHAYVDTIRAQLTTHEQALLLVHSLTPLGERWSDLIIRYNLVRNMPPEFFDTRELDVNKILSRDYFSRCKT